MMKWKVLAVARLLVCSVAYDTESRGLLRTALTPKDSESFRVAKGQRRILQVSGSSSESSSFSSKSSIVNIFQDDAMRSFDDVTLGDITLQTSSFSSESPSSSSESPSSTLDSPKSTIEQRFNGYRVWTTADMLDTDTWTVRDITLYPSFDCTGENYNDGTPVDSAHLPEKGPELAFASDISVYWNGLQDANQEWWIGMVYDSPRDVFCISYMDFGIYEATGINFGANSFKIEGRESSTSLWKEIMVVEDNQVGQMQDIPLPVPSLSPSTSSAPTSSFLPSMSPSQSMSPSTSFLPSSYPSYEPSNVPSEIPSMSPSIICGDSEIPIIVRVDITTDSYPEETFWKVTNIIGNQVVFESIFKAYTTPYFLYSKTHPVCPQDCFLFTVYDDYGDGLADGGSNKPGSYQVFFNNNLVHEGDGIFTSKDISAPFGLGCPSLEPSTSSVPTLSTKPSTKPSLSTEPSSALSSIPTSVPSSVPTSIPSYLPSTSSAPSTADPTSVPSSAPTSTPTLSFAPSISSAPSSALSSNPSSAPSLPLCTTSVSCTGVLAFFGLEPDCLLPECAGHCETDLDCAADLFCFKHDANGKADFIPGCETVPYGTINYCVSGELQPSSSPSRPPTKEPSISPTLTMPPTAVIGCPAWQQLGDAIDTTYLHFALASDRLVIAVREEQSVLVYRYVEDLMAWTQIANAINPDYLGTDRETHRLALSSDGGVVAIGDYDKISNGRVQVFAIHPDDGWIALGAVIDGENIGDHSGESLVLSADGTNVAIGADLNSDNGTISGHVRIFAYNIQTKDWDQRGDAINGTDGQNRAGYSTDMSADGSIVVIGSVWNAGNGFRAGRVRVFKFSVQDQSWDQLGNDIDGEKGDKLGWSVAMSRDGSVIAIGATHNSGYVQVYTYKSKDGEWVQRGQTISGEAMNDQSGYSVDISADGNTIAIGAPYNNGNGNDAGHLLVYECNTLDDECWIKAKDELSGKAASDYFGKVVSMSADGTVVGINGSGTKSLIFMRWERCLTPPSSMPSSTPSCPDGKSLLRLDLTTDRFPRQTTWEVKNTEDELVYSGGPYDEMFAFHSKTYCLDQGCYHFAIQDSSSDGICCDWFTGNGNYKLFFDSTLIQIGGNFTSEETSILIGSTCPSSVPSMVPSSEPTLRPSLSMVPSEFPSSVPSNRPSTVPTISLQPSTVPSTQPTESCPVGTFINNSTDFKCEPCQPGSYQNKATYSDKCIECEAGSYQPDAGRSECIICEIGRFQELPGQPQCKECRVGGYCSSDRTGTCGGGFTPCPTGTYNDKTGQGNNTACLPCPEGRYSDKVGLAECLLCPYRLGSLTNSITCSFCAKEFYLRDPKANYSSLWEKPNDLCLDCPENVKCPRNTTLETLVVPQGYWRDSNYTSKVYKCDNVVCNGSSTNDITASYCVEGNHGPRCELCINDDQYFSDIDGSCVKCPSLSKIAIVVGIIAGLAAIILLVRIAKFHYPPFEYFLKRFVSVIFGFNLQAKMKIMISFVQIVNALQSVYGVKLDSRLWAWANFLNIINFNILDLTIPGSCIGSMKNRLILGAVWPYFLIIFVIFAIFSHALMTVGMVGIKSNFKKFWSRTLYMTILILYLVLPSVSNSIFEAKKCEAFESNDKGVKGKESQSYLVADWSITCGSDSDEYSDLLQIFWIFLVCWPILIPLLFSGLLKSIHYTVQQKRTTVLADACGFLWRDYDESVIFWDIIDMMRKVFLTGFIMFVDAEEGSSRVFRLIIATVVSSFYMAILSYARPYKRQDDFHLALVSSILLICFFSLGIVIQLCDNDDDLCNKTIGLSFNAFKATSIAMILTATMLILTIVSFVIVTMNTMNVPTIRLATSGYEPNLEMLRHTNYHAFLSHVWRSGQGKTHAIVRMLQLHIPGIKVWLDVDDLENIDMLEKSVANCAVVIIFYSEGYFESRNCRRELYAAVEQNKPIIVLYDGTDGVVENINEECDRYCSDNQDPAKVLNRVCAAEHILWLTGKYFSHESMKLLTKEILKFLPYYQRRKTELNKGLKLAGQLGTVALSSQLNILVCNDNVGCMEVAEEVVALAQEDSGLIVPHALVFEDVLSQTFVDNLGDTKKVLLFYINENIFEYDENVYGSLKYALEANIDIVMVNEQDLKKGACEFSCTIRRTPPDLVVSGLYNNLAVPLYELDVYRKISIRQVLLAMGAQPAILKKTVKSSITRKTDMEID